ncbi:hypothetical protein LCGC14_1715740 [marine sediment metagenome]|uniref:Uncharacterized protein n=1 Tax=marine sediment metagenome TaxID=412755 RepID=A0A0F9HDL2_9ZZZZ
MESLVERLKRIRSLAQSHHTGTLAEMVVLDKLIADVEQGAVDELATDYELERRDSER